APPEEEVDEEPPPEAAVADGDAEAEADIPNSAEHPLQLAIVGRPNSGKSTLVNRLIGEERVLTGPEPGVTRDAIHIDWLYKDQHIRLVDTAGVRRRARITDAVEKLAVGETFDAVRMAEVGILLVDAESPLD